MFGPLFVLAYPWSLIASVVAVILAAGLNRIRGIGKGEFVVYGKLPAALGIGLVATFFHGPVWGLAWAGCYLFWASFAWGRWFALGRFPRGWNREGKPANSYEKVIESIAGDSDHLAFGIRMAFASPFLGILGGLIGGPIAASAFPLAAVGIYELAWRIRDKGKIEDPILIAEPALGLVWGLLIVLT
jgi:hypothetical protein